MLLALLLLTGMFPVPSLAQEAAEEDIPTSSSEPLFETEPALETAPSEPEDPIDPTVPEETEPEPTTEPATAPTEETPSEEPEQEPVGKPTEDPGEDTLPDETEPEPTEEETIPEPEITRYTNDLWGDVSPEEVYEYYADALFYPEHSVSPFGTVAREQLTGAKARLYDAMKPFVKDIANGEKKTAKLKMGTAMYGKTPSIKVNLSGLSAQDIFDVLDALFLDMPYEMYWHRTSCVWTWSKGSSRYFEVLFDIWAPYHDGSYKTVKFSDGSVQKYHYTANTARTGAAKKAASNARNLVARYEGQTDYQKLLGYAQWIADAVQYDHWTAENDGYNVDYSPYTLINVFDGDPSTNIVCMGYAKSFQYLCDLSTFSRVTCHYARGYTWVNGVKSDAGHAWNLVDVEGTRYLIDITGYDTGTNGRYNALYFMAGASRTAADRYPIAYWEYDHDKERIKRLFGTTDVNLSKSYYNASSVSYAAAEQAGILNGSSDVTGGTVYVPLGKYVYLDSYVSPATARQTVTWSSSDTDVVTVSSSGRLTPVKKGSATIRITVSDSTKKSASVTVNVVQPMESLTIPETLTLIAGKSYTFRPGISPSSTSVKTLNWTISGDTQAATISSKGVLKTNASSTRSYITVTAASTDGSNLKAACRVTIYPPTKSIAIYNAGTPVTGKTVKLPLGQSLNLDPVLTPSEARTDIKWKSSDSKIAKVSAEGIVTPVKTGKVKLTASSQDGTEKKATVTIQVVRLVTSVTLPEKVELTSGSSYTLKPSVKPSSATSKSVSWTISGDTEAVKFSKGVLTAKTVTEMATVTVTATAKDGSGKSATCIVTIHPKAKSAAIRLDGSDVTGQRIRREMDDTMVLNAIVSPYDARQSVSWKSSDTKIAKINSQGVVTPVKPGKVTFTATTKDGTKKTAKVTVTFYKLMDSLSISGPSTVIGGESITLKATPKPSYTSDKSIRWEVWSSGGLDGVTISSKGVLRTPAVTQAVDITVAAFAMDGSWTSGYHEVTILPEATEVVILENGVPVTTATLKKGKTLYLEAEVFPYDATQKVKWTSSRSSIATVSSSGVVKAKAKGTTVITAKATDGSGKKATIKITVK